MSKINAALDFDTLRRLEQKTIQPGEVEIVHEIIEFNPIKARQKGMEQGIEQGIQQERQKMAAQLLSDGMGVQKVADLTEMSIEDVSRLQKG